MAYGKLRCCVEWLGVGVLDDIDAVTMCDNLLSGLAL